MTDAPTHLCSFCLGTGFKHGASGIGHGVPSCDWCNGLGAVFSEYVLRGHPAMDGCSDMIEGPLPVQLAFEHEGETLIFQRESSPIPPYWFIKEHGKQVFRYVAKLETKVRTP